MASTVAELEAAANTMWLLWGGALGTYHFLALKVFIMYFLY